MPTPTSPTDPAVVDHPLKKWIAITTKDEQEYVADLAGTSVNYFYQLATLRREPLVGLAFKIEHAMNRLHDESKGRIPRVTAAQLAEPWIVAGLV